MKLEHNKLIRDCIPQIIEESETQYDIEILPEEEYRFALFEKLIEEAKEMAISTPDELVTEIADLYEVIDAILATHQISEGDVRKKQNQKRKERGGFQKRIRLLWTANDRSPG